MKTIPVKEVAEALGISARGVLYRREKGHLKGVLVKNDRGVDEYRIYPTKEIIEGLRKLGSSLVASNEAMADFEVVDQTVVPEEDKVLDSTYGEDDIVDATPITPRKELSEDNKNAANAVVDQLWNGIIERFTEKLAEKDQLIGEMRADIADKDRRLLLLPDHEAIKRKAEEEANKIADIERDKAEAARKKAEEERLRAEQERKNAEAKELESEALKKQIIALQAEQQEAEQAKKKIDELEQALTENQRQAQEEIERLKDEKDAHAKAIEELRAADEAKLAEKEAQAAAIQEQLQALSATVEELKKPKPSWWKKWFTAPEPPAVTK